MLGAQDAWGAGDAYERYMGRWSRLVASAFLDWLALPAGLRWLDVGCGTGALSQTVLERGEPVSVLGIDPSEGFVAAARTQVTDGRARFEVGDAMDLPPVSVDVAVSGLALNFVPDPAAAVVGMRRCAPDGSVAAYLWDYAGDMQFLRRFWDAAVSLDGRAAELDEGGRFPLCQPEPLEELWRHGGLTDVTVTALDVPTVFRDFDDYWTPFLGGQGPAPGYVLSLDDRRRQALRDRLQSELPVARDGTISLVARAWAVRGRSR